MKSLLLIIAGALLLGIATGVYFVTVGVSARPQPSGLETGTARALRSIAIRARVRGITNPVPASDAVIKEGMEHFADHCASCHANDGSGNTEMGRGLYPRAPDMRLAATQEMTDGELFYVIEQGIRFTGMPGWSTGTPAGEESSWHLVHFVRRLPHLTKIELDEMAALNPRSPAEIREEIEQQRFLEGSDVQSPPPAGTPEHHHGGGH